MRFAIDNLFALGTTSASDELAETGVHQNAYTGVEYDKWRQELAGEHWAEVDSGSDTPFNCAGIVWHNLFSKGVSSLSIETSPDGVVWTSVGTLPVTSDDPIFSVFDDITSRYQRARFVTTSDDSYIGHIHIGKTLDSPRGQRRNFGVPMINNLDSVRTNKGVTGVLLGRSKDFGGVSIDIRMKLVRHSWVSQNWEAFVEKTDATPFFTCWSDYYPEVVFGMANDKKAPVMPYTQFYELAIDQEGIKVKRVTFGSPDQPGAGCPQFPGDCTEFSNNYTTNAQHSIPFTISLNGSPMPANWMSEGFFFGADGDEVEIIVDPDELKLFDGSYYLTGSADAGGLGTRATYDAYDCDGNKVIDNALAQPNFFTEFSLTYDQSNSGDTPITRFVIRGNDSAAVEFESPITVNVVENCGNQA